MPFGFFKKKKKEEDTTPHYDPNHIRIIDIRVGFFVEYDARTWEVAEEYEYDWGDNEFSYSYLLRSSDDEIYLSLENDGELEIAVTNKIRLMKLGEDLDDQIAENERPPKTITYEGVKYYRDNESPGYYRNTATTEREKSIEMITWDYYDDDEEKTISIEQFGEREFEAYIGVYVEEFEFSNIIPSSTPPTIL
jgi:hypothetical protein